MKRDKDGMLWMHTGDEAILDEEGYLRSEHATHHWPVKRFADRLLKSSAESRFAYFEFVYTYRRLISLVPQDIIIRGGEVGGVREATLIAPEPSFSESIPSGNRERADQ